MSAPGGESDMPPRRCPGVAALLVFPRATPGMVREHARPGVRVVAVDGGADACRAAGVRPDRIVGDLDSADPATVAHFEALGVPIERHPSAKRDTDAALALAGLRSEREIVFLGAGGGRVDHALANLHLLADAARWASVRAVDEDALTYVATPERPVALDLPEGLTLSILPWDPRCEGIQYEGLLYPLEEAVMTTGDPYGMSNVTGPPPQRVRVRSGRLLVVRPLGPS